MIKTQPEPFGDLLRAIRERRGLTQAQVDRATDRKPSWTAHLEAGTIPAPSQDVCARLAQTLGVDSAELGRAAAYARLAHAEPEALAIVLADRGDAGASSEVGDQERLLVLALRRLDQEVGRSAGHTAASLVRLVNLILTRGHPAATSGPDPQSARRALDALDEASHHAARAVMDIAVRATDILDAERTRLGLASPDPPPPRRRRGGRTGQGSS